MHRSAHAVTLDVAGLDVDFACGGSVKWLCGGPGAAYLYVRPDLISTLSPRVTGWFASRAPFAFTMPDQQYAEDVGRFGSGTLAIAPLYQARAGAELIGRLGADSSTIPSMTVISERNPAQSFASSSSGVGMIIPPIAWKGEQPGRGRVPGHPQ